MKKNILYTLLVAACLIFYSCGKNVEKDEHEGHDHGTEGHNHNDHEGHDHDHEGHDHGDEGEEKTSAEKGGEHENEIVFTQKQAANILSFKVVKIEPQTFYDVIKVSGQIVSAPGDEAMISAPITGIVKFSGNITEGYSVSSGQSLFRISGENLGENSVSTKLIEVKSVYENAKSEYDRASALIGDKIISQQEFDRIKSEYKQAEANYKNLARGMSGLERTVNAPMTGFLKNIMVQSGQYVEVGTPIASVTKNQKLILRADVSQRYASRVRSVQSANFTTPYDNVNYDLKDLNGRLVSFGKTAGNSFYIPVNFEFDNKGDIVAGSYVEVYLKSSPLQGAMVVPKVALIEDQGHYFVFVQEAAEVYEKREVQIGATDGTNFQILKGISAGDKVVFEGAYALKLASQQSEVPAHSHSH